jgi:tRNA (cytidine56-2'-O)-methyltransferase
MRIEVLRLGHRPDRDKRMTTHVCLTARALGATRVHVDAPDSELEGRIARVREQFGGDMEVRTGVDPRSLVKGTDLRVVHLTMYGENVAGWGKDRWDELRAGPGVLVVVGATKVPREFYELAHVNAAVGNQPHSEVAALAVFLDRLTGGEPLARSLGGRVTIVPTSRGKEVLITDDDGGDDGG